MDERDRNRISLWRKYDAGERKPVAKGDGLVGENDYRICGTMWPSRKGEGAKGPWQVWSVSLSPAQGETRKLVAARTARTGDGACQRRGGLDRARARHASAGRRRARRRGGAALLMDYAALHAGWRTIGGQRGYYRSRWEANYARYLEFLRRAGVILAWRHEPKTFWFEKIRRGVRSYLPDFEVGYPDGRTVYHEVKGYFDAKSRTKLKRMAKYHPDVEVRVIAAREYRDIRRRLSPLLKGWE